ncbi:hypothetical protein RhiirC2_794449 [Rhizophagus irregularis]|uniref:Uncharacterized protein n=1 Tax=Rhizophagus irregularis TaxID=588596 RepID=A0A2N1MDI7_9GLOM|nr:hypothetical protein RhiirC2_794449 [Rhizophagus irregularis]
MAALGRGFNPNILLNALNNLTNTLGAGRNNWANVNNAVNILNATLTANNNALQTRETQAAQILTFYVLAYLKGAAAVWYQSVIGNPVNAWDAFAYPDNIQARKFISRLLPELYVAVKPFSDQTLQAAIDHARACELTLREGKSKLNNYVTIQSETTELARIVSTLVTQVGELTKKVKTQPGRYRAPQNDDQQPPRDNANYRNIAPSNTTITCYTYGQPGHISRRSTGDVKPDWQCDPAFKLEGASLEGKGAKPDQNPSFCTLFGAYPAQRSQPVTRSHLYVKPDEEQEASPPVSNIVRESMAEVQPIPSEGNNRSSNEKEKGTVLNTINPPSTSAAVN